MVVTLSRTVAGWLGKLCDPDPNIMQRKGFWRVSFIQPNNDNNKIAAYLIIRTPTHTNSVPKY